MSLPQTHLPSTSPTAPIEGIPTCFPAADGFALHGHLWSPATGVSPAGTVVVAPATGVLARYYARYARFLAGQGFAVLTFDYRGIGLSRPLHLQGRRLRHLQLRWADWGRLDLQAALTHAERYPRPLAVVGHSIGGVLVGYAARAPTLDRVLTVGAQFAYWRDYAPARRLDLWLRWHAVMPALTRACGYFPGRRLGWLEDLPRGVALDWSARRSRLEACHPPAERAAVRASFAAVRAPMLAITATDDPFATPAAVRRTLDYFTGAERAVAVLAPADFGRTEIGHFALFHEAFRDSFWPATADWLRAKPFAGARAYPAPAGGARK